MKKRGMGLFIALGGIALVLIAASIFLIVSGSYTARLVLVNDGFFVDDVLHDSLFANDEYNVMSSINAIRATQSDILYEKSGKLYLGDEYTPVSQNFPYVINNASAVMFTGNVDKLLTGTFEYVDSYENLYMSGGVTFNSDMERAYREDFILIDTGNGVYMNADKLTVGGSLTTSGEIPVNSFIRFMEDRIDYYYYDNEKLVYSAISPVSRTANISIGSYNYTYIEFLEKLGLYSERKARDKAASTPTPTPIPEGESDSYDGPTPTRQIIEVKDTSSDEDLAELLPVSTDSDSRSSDRIGKVTENSEEPGEPLPIEGIVREDDGEREVITPNPQERPTREPRPTQVPPTAAPAEDPLPPEDDGNRVTPTRKPTSTPLPTPTPLPPIASTGISDSPAPAAPAPAAAPAQPAQTGQRPPETHKPPKDKPARPVYFKDWKKPVVHLGDVTTGTYTIFMDNFHIENGEYVYQRYGVQIYVREGEDENGVLSLTKSVTGSGAIRLAQPFKPNTKYTLEVVLNYVNAYGEVMVETVVKYGDIVVETKGRDYLDQLDLTYQKDRKASNSFKYKDFGIGIAIDNPTDSFIEAVQYMDRFEFSVKNVDDPNDARVVKLSSSDLSKIRKGIPFDFESARVFRSNSRYTYEIRAYDTKGGILKFKDGTSSGTEIITGAFETCTEKPNATFRVLSNKIYDYTVAIRLANPGNANMKNTKYMITDLDGNEVPSTVVYPASGAAIGFDPQNSEGPVSVHQLSSEQLQGIYDPTPGASGIDPNRVVEITTRFKDLSDQTVYKLLVFSDIDIYDYDVNDFENGEVPDSEKWHESELIGEIRFTTAAISSLGNLFIENIIPETEENLSEGRLYMNLRLGERTNKTLIQLLDDVKFGFYKKLKNEDGEEIPEYVLDENARISYVICDVTEDTQYMDISSILTAKRPNELEEWEQEATLAGQRAYDDVYRTYNSIYAEIRRDYTFTEIIEGEEQRFTLDNYFEYARNAELAIGTGDYHPDSDEYKEFVAWIDKYNEASSAVDNEAMRVTEERAQAARKGAYDESLDAHDASDPSKFYDSGSFVIGSAHAGYEEDIIDALSQQNPAYDSGSTDVYKYQKELRIVVTGLSTNTTYEFMADAKATVGTSGKQSRVRTTVSRTAFKTYRKKATIKMDAHYAASDFISLFGVGIDDPDGAIEEYPITLTVTNRVGSIMGIRTFENADSYYDEIRFGALSAEEEYTLTFTAEKYNKGWSRASSEVGKEIFVNDRDTTLTIVTHESIVADISLIGINEAYDLAPEVRIMVKSTSQNGGNIYGKFAAQVTDPCNTYLTKGTCSDGNVYIAGANQKIKNQNAYVRKAVYTINYNLGDEQYNIIEPAIYPTRNRFTRYQLFADEECTEPLSDANDPNAEVRVTAYNASTNAGINRSYWTSNYIRLNKYLTGSGKVYLQAIALNISNPLGGQSYANSGVYMFTGVSFHKFGERAYTANINAVLKDEYGQLGSAGVSKYYIRVYEKEGEEVGGDSGYALISERVHQWRELKQGEDREHETDNCLLTMHEYDKYSVNGLGDSYGVKTFVGGAKQIDTNFGINVNFGKYYRLELWIKINNYSLRVGTSVFTSDRTIHSINNYDDLLDAYCHPSDSYVVTSDIVVARANIFQTKQFDGVLDFNGHTLIHKSNEYLIYQLGAYGQVKNLVFQKGADSDDPDFYDNYKNVRGVVYNNYGTLSGITVNYKNRIQPIRVFDGNQWNWTGRDYRTDKAYNFVESQYVQGLLATNNYPTAVVENFCINVLEDIHFYAGDGVGLAVYNNYGMVRNGYSCSENGSKIHQVALLEEFNKIIQDPTQAKNSYTSNYYTGGLVRRNLNGVIEGTYGLVNMELRNNDGNSIYRCGAAICGRNEGYVRNSFSAAAVLTLTEKVGEPQYIVKTGRSPANLNFVEGNNVYGYSSNIYHYGMGYDYGICKDGSKYDFDSIEIKKEILYDPNWYRNLFDSEDLSKPGQWDYDFLQRNLYPHVKMDECMPAQPNMPLPYITSLGAEVVPLAANVNETNDVEANVTFTFYNPNKLIINSVVLDYISGRVVDQWESGRFYYARVRLQNPVKYLSRYYLTGIRYSMRGSSQIYDKEFTNESERLPINVEFFKMVRSVSDFFGISTGTDALKQNYALASDIDFFGYKADDYCIGTKKNGVLTTDYSGDNNTGCFSGKFDGRGHTLLNIDVGNVGFVFSKVSGPLYNFNVRNIHTPNTAIYGESLSTAKYMGLVGVFREGGSLDNVHVYGARFENITQFCGVLLARNYFENNITNCSVHDVYLQTGMPVDNSTAASVGCIAGHNDLGLNISNCYVDNFEIDASVAGDVYGIGSAVGYTVNGIQIENYYAVRGKINTNYSNVGGVVGSIQSMNDVSVGYKNDYYTQEYFIRNYYVDVEIVTMAENVGGVIGYTSKLSGWDYNYGVVFGRIVPKSASIKRETLGPIVGYYTGSSSASNPDKNGIRLGKHQYVYENFEIDGEKCVPYANEESETSRLAYFKPITFAELTTVEKINDSMTYGWEDALMRPRLAWKDAFEVNAADLSIGTLPKLYFSYLDEEGKKKLLPGQEGFSLIAGEVEIVGYNIANYSGGDNDAPVLTVDIRHDPDKIKIDDLTFDGTSWLNNNHTSVSFYSTTDAYGFPITRIVGTLQLYDEVNIGGFDRTVPYAVDKFFIKSIKYRKSTVATMSAIEAIAAAEAAGPAGASMVEEVEKEVYYRLKELHSGYIYISSALEWNQLMTPDRYGRRGFNVYLTGDLSFTDAMNSPQMNVIVNNIIGNAKGKSKPLLNPDGTYNTAQRVKIENVHIFEDDTSGNSSSFIAQVLGTMQGIDFVNCSVSQTYKTGVTGKKVSNKVSLVGIVNGKIDEVTMTNIDLNAFRAANIAPIGFAYGISTNVKLTDINVVQHKAGSSGYITSYSNRGGYVAFMGKFAGINGLTANRIYIDCAGANQGGIVGTQVGATYIWNVNATDVVSYSRASATGIGGLVGYMKDRGIRQRAGMLHVTNVFVKGGSQTGGIGGRLFIGGWDSDGYRRVSGDGIKQLLNYNTLDTGTASETSVRSWVKRGLILSYSGQYVGGAVGLGGVWKTTVEDSVVLGGDSTGGVVGRYAAIDADARNVYVSRWQEKVNGHAITSGTRYKDSWPSMFFWLGGRDTYYAAAIDVASAKSGKKVVNTDFTPETELSTTNKGGKYFEWREMLFAEGIDSVSDPVLKEARNNFWTRSLRGMTSLSSWKINGGTATITFGEDEKTKGQSGIVRERLVSRIPSSMNSSDATPIHNLTTDVMLAFKANTQTYDGWNSTRFDYIGGVVGYATGLRSDAVKDCMVYAPRSMFVGGIAGRVSAYDSNYTAIGGTYGMMVQNTKVIGGDYVGGLYGDTYRYNTTVSLVDGNTYVEGRKAPASGRTGQNVGGIAGRVYMSSSVPSEQPQLRNLLSGATVVGVAKVGGIVGYMDMDFYTDVSDYGWAMLGKVIINGDFVGSTFDGGDMFLTRKGGWINYFSKAILHENSTVKFMDHAVDYVANTLKNDSTTQTHNSKTASQFVNSLRDDLQTRVTIVSTNNLKNLATYTTLLGWADSSGLSKDNYTSKRFKYDQLSNGKLPYMTLAASIQNSYAQGIETMYPGNDGKGQERRMLLDIPDPAAVSGSGSGGSGLGAASLDLSDKPAATIYASGADMFSIDFSKINPEYRWTVSCGGSVASGVIDRKTISFTYDFVSDITAVITAPDGEETVVTASGSQLAQYVSAAGGTYNVIMPDGIVRGSGSSSLPTRYGDYVNIFDGKALERDGSVIEVESGVVTSAADRGTSLMDERTPEPLSKGEFGGFRIETYATYSRTTKLSTGEVTEREGFLFYTDGNSLQSIRTSDRVKPDSVILWTEQENTYFAALGKDKVLKVLLDGAFRVPESISTEEIYEMSSSREIKAPYCIVRYTNGGVCAFNFVTGDILYESAGGLGISAGGGDASSSNSAVSFSHAKELTEALKSGAVNLEGIVQASPLSRNAETQQMPSVDSIYVDGVANDQGDVTGNILTDGIAANGDGLETGDEVAFGQEAVGEIAKGTDATTDNTGDEEAEGLYGEQGTQAESTDTSASGSEQGSVIGGESGTGESPVSAGGMQSSNDEGNTLNGTNTQSGNEAAEEGIIAGTNVTDPNSLIGTSLTQTSIEGVDPNLLADVEAEVDSLISDGSISLDNIADVLAYSDVEAKSKLFGAAAHIADEGGLAPRDAVLEAYKDIVLNPAYYLDIPEVLPAAADADKEKTALMRDIVMVTNSGKKADSVDASSLMFVPVFNPETGEYEVFEMEELLAGKEEQLKSIEERLADNGRFINTSGFRAGAAEESKASRDYRGFIAILFAVLLAGGLAWALIYKKRKEGNR